MRRASARSRHNGSPTDTQAEKQKKKVVKQKEEEKPSVGGLVGTTCTEISHELGVLASLHHGREAAYVSDNTRHCRGFTNAGGAIHEQTAQGRGAGLKAETQHSHMESPGYEPDHGGHPGELSCDEPLYDPCDSPWQPFAAQLFNGLMQACSHTGTEV